MDEFKDVQLMRLVIAATEKALEDTATEVQIEARVLAPYDTGALHDSIIAERESQMVYKVTANTNYALHVHEGHKTASGGFVEGKPFLTVPLQEKKQLILSKIKQNIG